MSLFEIQGVKFERGVFVTFSDWRPPDRYPENYRVCRICRQPFYTRSKASECPRCRDILCRLP